MSVNAMVKLAQGESAEHGLRRLKRALDKEGFRRDETRTAYYTTPGQAKRARRHAAERRRERA